MPTLENRRKGKISSQTSRSKNEYIEKEQGTRGGEKVEEENEEAAEGDACGFNEGGVGLPMKYWYHFVYNIVGGVFEGKRRVWGRRSDSSTFRPWNTLWPLLGREQRGKWTKDRERRGRRRRSSVPDTQPGIPFKELSLSRGLDRCASTEIPSIGLILTRADRRRA